jgi:hypothetical protein
MSNQVRVTVSINAEHLEVYKEMARLGKLSVSRCLGEWLGDTIESAQYVTRTMDRARKAPQLVLNEMLAELSGVHDEILKKKSEVRTGKARVGAAPAPRARALTPPLSNTGVKGYPKGRKRG